MPVEWSATVLAVTPRIHLTRSFDQRSREYLGYAVRLDGTIAGAPRTFAVAVGKAAHAKHAFRRGDAVSGRAEPVARPEADWIDVHKASGLRVVERGPAIESAPPWYGVPPAIDAYRERGMRRLARPTFDTTCAGCMWGVEMAVTMIVDQWKPDVVRYRTETFCYGPKSCPIYRPGPRRVVPGRKGMSYEEPDWVDEEETSHRDD